MFEYPPARRTDVAQQFSTANTGSQHSPSLVSVPNTYSWLEDEDSDETKTFVAEQNKSLNSHLLTDSSEAVKTRLMTLLRSQVQGEEISQAPESAGEYYLLRVSGCGRPFPITFKFKKSDLGKLLQPLRSGPTEYDPQTEGMVHSFHDEAASGAGKLLSSGVSGSGKYWAYCTSVEGSDWGIIRVKEVETGRELQEEIRDTKFNNSRKPITWLGNSGFFYQFWQFSEKRATSYPQLRYHALGTCQADDVLIYEEKSNPGRCFWLNLTADEKFAILSIYGSGQECQVLASRLQVTENRPVVDFSVQICDNFDYKWEYIGRVLRGDQQLYTFLTDRNNGEIVGFSLDGSTTGSTLLVEGVKQQTLKLAQVIGDCSILLIRSKDVCDRIQTFSTVDGELSAINAPLATVFDVQYSAATKDIFLIASSFSQPFSLWHIDGKTLGSAHGNSDQPQLVKVHPTTLASTTMGGVSSTQVFYTSADGTRVPMFLIANDSCPTTADTPILLYIYGGFSISVIPHFRPDFLVFIKAFRGIVAIANIRGGGEYGRSWYRAACGQHRQRVFDDIHGALQHLAHSFGTLTRRPILMGESMGALNAMSAILQQPGLVSAALLNAGPFDILRRQTSGMGLRGVEDIGDETDPVQFAHIHKWSPLENVGDGQRYPPALLTAGDRDDLVKCANSCKMVATLQHAQRLLEGNSAVHLRVIKNLGHGGAVSTEKQAVISVERWLWLAITLGLKVY